MFKENEIIWKAISFPSELELTIIIKRYCEQMSLFTFNCSLPIIYFIIIIHTTKKKYVKINVNNLTKPIKILLSFILPIRVGRLVHL